jgi:adenine-specific DNA glycosylase
VAILRHGNQYYCEQVPEGKPWHGLWRFPDFDKSKMRGGRILTTIKYGITKYAVTMDVVEAQWKGRAPVSMSVRYLTVEDMAEFAFAAPHRKIAKTLLAKKEN